MAKIFRLQNLPLTALRKRRGAILTHLAMPEDAIRASIVEQYLTCGKVHCRCRRGFKHGPFYYLVQCVHTGQTRKFLLKNEAQKIQGEAAIAAYLLFQEKLEELSQINTELLRRMEG